jgi:predicted membrane protein DUF2231
VYSIAGLPLHPLLVHATVVVVPTAALCVLLAAMWPRFRAWAGPLPLGLAVAGLVLDPLSTSSGESLEHQMGHSALIEKHSHLADGLLPWLIGLVVVAAGLYGWHWRHARRTTRDRSGSPAWVPIVISGLAVLVAVGTSVQVVLIGHSGAKAAWSSVAAHSSGARSASK